LSNKTQNIRSQQLLRRALKDIETAMKLLDFDEVLAISRLRNAIKDVKVAEAQIR
jgi:hypothetical protein